jgi:hypothetical protein
MDKKRIRCVIDYTFNTTMNLLISHSSRQAAQTRTAVIFVTAIAVIAALALLIFLTYTVATTTIPFDNDEAEHAVDGWQVYHSLIRLNFVDLFQTITSQAFYPFFHSFFVAIAYLFDGGSVASSRMPTVFCFALTVLGLGWLTLKIARQQEYSLNSGDRWFPWTGAMLAVSLTITSPIFVTNAVLCMLEMTGSMLAILLMLVGAHIDRIRHQRSRLMGIAIAAFLVMAIVLTKYSFGLFYAPALLAALGTATRPGKWGRRVWLEITVVLAIYLTILLVWILITNRAEMWRFFTGHPSYVDFWSLENFLYYPISWLNQYSAKKPIGLISLTFAAIGAVRYWKHLPVRVAFWSVMATIAVLTVSTTNSQRHMFVIAPAIWMLAGLGFVKVLQWLARTTKTRPFVVSTIALIWTLLIACAIEPASQIQARLKKAFEGVPVYAEMQEFGLQNVDLNQPVLLLGLHNDRYKVLAVRWRAAVLSGKRLEELNIDYFPFEHRESSLRRAGRKPQKASVDPSFPRKPLDAILDRGYYAYLIETRNLQKKSDLPYEQHTLDNYPTVSRKFFSPWLVTVYKTEN